MFRRRRKPDPLPEIPSDHAFRCSICSYNWPYYRDFEYCPLCEEPTRGIRLLAPDEPLTLEEAASLCAELGVELPKVCRRVGLRLSNERQVERLHAALADWADHRPDWMK